MLLLAALLLAACLCFAGAPAQAGPINLNAADAATLASELKGVGKVKAQAIIDFRQKHGPFRSVDELAQVKGFSQKLIDRNRADIKLGPVTAAPQGAARPATGAAAPKGDGAHATPPKSVR
jgi:competence protein ComEA